MSSDPMIRFEIKILNRVYPILINQNEENIAVEIERELNEKISEIQQKYAGQDLVDLLTMAFISKAFDNKKNQNGQT